MFCGQFRTAARSFSTSAMRSSKLNGKAAIVTGSTDGIGLAIARRLAQDGAKVVISSRKQENVTKAVEELKSEGLSVLGVPCHVGKDDQRKNLVKFTMDNLGSIDIFVSNAGMNPQFGNMLQCTEAQWDKLFDINLKAGFMLTKEIAPTMQKKGGGSIIFVSSFAGLTPMPLIGPYSVSKTALIGLTKALSGTLGEDNIRVNCIAPGVIRTKFAEALTSSDFVADQVLGNTPLKRFGTPEEMGGIVSFLASEDAAYITGETVVLSGGAPSRL